MINPGDAAVLSRFHRWRWDAAGLNFVNRKVPKAADCFRIEDAAARIKTAEQVNGFSLQHFPIEELSSKASVITHRFSQSVVRPASITLAIIVYAATASQLIAGNLLVNGDFEQGNTGFATQYAYTPGGGTKNVALAYTVDKNTLPWASNFTIVSSYGDHTTGSGLMLLCNGATTAHTIAWSETAPVTPNTTYTFSAWVSSIDSFLPANLDFVLNGGTPLSYAAPSSGGVWQQFSTTVNSGNNTSMAMQIYDTNLSEAGNDFALDHISLTPNPTPEPGTFVLSAIGGRRSRW